MVKNQTVLFRKITLISPDHPGQCTVLPDAWVLVRNGVIAYVGQDEGAVWQQLGQDSHETCDGRNRLILPAFANTHSHLAMSLLRNQADDLNLQDWLAKVIIPREELLNAELVRQGTLLGLAEMIRSGTGAAADMYYFGEAAAEAALDAGFRLNFCSGGKVTDSRGQTKAMPQVLQKDLQQYHGHPSGLLRVSLLVHSVYSYDSALYPELAAMALAYDCPVQVHLAETRREVENCLRQYGCRPPRQLEQFGFFQTPTIAAHCVHLNDEDRAILASHAVLAAHNPTSNLKLGSGIADVPAMLQAGMAVGLGTDGAASNNSLDLYREMRLASYLAKGLSGDAAALPASVLLNMATSQGMAGLGFPGSGRIAAGCPADLQVVDLDCPELTPLGDPVTAMVCSMGGSQVESLMVGGRWLMYKRHLQTIDEAKVLADARQAARKLHPAG